LVGLCKIKLSLDKRPHGSKPIKNMDGMKETLLLSGREMKKIAFSEKKMLDVIHSTSSVISEVQALLL